MKHKLRNGAAALAVLVTGAVLAQGGIGLEAAESDEYGRYLADAEGRALYLFTADTRGEGATKAVSDCYDSCADAWPPLIAEGEVMLGQDLQEDLLGQTQRRDGQMQVTYAGWPLYYFVKDEGTDEVNGQDIHSFGGEWYLVEPGGSKNEQMGEESKESNSY